MDKDAPIFRGEKIEIPQHMVEDYLHILELGYGNPHSRNPDDTEKIDALRILLGRMTIQEEAIQELCSEVFDNPNRHPKLYENEEDMRHYDLKPFTDLWLMYASDSKLYASQGTLTDAALEAVKEYEPENDIEARFAAMVQRGGGY